MHKPSTAVGYADAPTSLVRSTCLYVATKLGDMMDDLVIVGGLVPSLIIDQEDLPRGATAHVGTMDLDFGLSVALLDQERYKSVSDRLRSAGFGPDLNASGNPSRQRWVIGREAKVTVDFLIEPTLSDDCGGKIRDFERDFAAFIMPGLGLAFEDQIHVSLSGKTLYGESATRTVRVCGPGAYVVLKALALKNRGQNKDAYDLFYVLRNFGSGYTDVASRLAPLLRNEHASEAIAFLEANFTQLDHLGPMRVAEFLVGGPNDEIQADALGFVAGLLGEVERRSRGGQ